MPLNFKEKGMKNIETTLQRIADAVQKFSIASSELYGVDCYLHGALSQKLLQMNNIDSRIVVGFAAWRVGDGDGDVVTHRPQPGVALVPGSAPYHVWLEIADQGDDGIYDVTTYQLPDKARSLDALDGGHTTVSWSPSYIWMPRVNVSTFHAVVQGAAGLFYYEESAQMRQVVLSHAKPIDDIHLETLQLILQNPDVRVIGNNHVRAALQSIAD